MKRSLARLTAVVFLAVALMSGMVFNVSAESGIGILDASNWSNPDKVEVSGSDVTILTGETATGYIGEKFLNETFKFALNYDISAESAWPFIAVRYTDPGKKMWEGEGATGYAFCISKGNLELHKLSGAAGKEILIQKPNTYITGKDDLIEFSAVDVGTKSVRITLKVNGVEAYSHLDSVNPIKSGGYFHVHSWEGTDITLKGLEVVAAPGTYGDTTGVDSAPILEVPESILDAGSWKAGSAEIAVEGSDVTIAGGTANFLGQKFGDGLLEFDFTSDLAGWPFVAIRYPEKVTDMWNGDSSGYAFVISQGNIEIQYFPRPSANENGEQNVLAGVANNYFFAEELHKVKFGAVNEDEGVRVILIVNDKLVFNYLDTSEHATTEPGYLNVHFFDSPNTLGFPQVAPAGEEPDVTDEEPDVTDEEPDVTNEEPDVTDEEPDVTEEPVTNPDTGVVAIPFIAFAVAGTAGVVISRRKLR